MEPRIWNSTSIVVQLHTRTCAIRGKLGNDKVGNGKLGNRKIRQR